MVRFLRRLVADAGNLKLVEFALEIALRSGMPGEFQLWEEFNRRYPELTGKKPRLTSPRSAEPHVALAKELDLLDHRWLISGEGKAFLKLHRLPDFRKFDAYPGSLILAQLLRNDLEFLIRFLNYRQGEEQVCSGKEPFCKDPSWDRLWKRYPVEVVTEKILNRCAIARTWNGLWKRYGSEMKMIEPEVPENLGRRTILHQCAARIRLFESLGLEEKHLKSLADSFQKFDGERLPPDLFLTLGNALLPVDPPVKCFGEFRGRVTLMKEQDILEKIRFALQGPEPSLRGPTGYASSGAVFLFINELGLREGKAADRDTFLKVMKNHSYTSPREAGDVLFMPVK